MALQNLFGDLGLDSSLQKIVAFLQNISNTVARVYPDTAGRIRVNIETGTVSTVNNVAAAGGYNAQYDQYCQMMNNASYIRSRITTS